MICNSKFARVQYIPACIDPDSSMAVLGYEHDDYGKAISKVIREWARINGK
jgi:hypothetical protein